MLLHATIKGIADFLMKSSLNLKEDQCLLLAHLIVANKYYLESLEKKNDIDAFWFLENDSANTSTAHYQYSVRLEDFYIEICKTLILHISNFDLQKNDIIPIAVYLFDILKKFIYKIKDNEKCIYIYICQNEGVSKAVLYDHFMSKKDNVTCYYNDQKTISFECAYKDNKNCCTIVKKNIEMAIESLINNKAIDLFEDDEKGVCYKCAW